jgi:ABC-type polysaccharide/polyol phosphate export permease
MFTLSLSLLLAMANLFYRDVKYLFELTVTIWMFMTAVLYPVSQVGGLMAKVMLLNPMTPIIDGYREVLLRGSVPEPSTFLITTVASAAFLVLAWVVFHRGETEFAENI